MRGQGPSTVIVARDPCKPGQYGAVAAYFKLERPSADYVVCSASRGTGSRSMSFEPRAEGAPTSALNLGPPSWPFLH
jgi:hypothetical protein